MDEHDSRQANERMIRDQIIARGVRDSRVIEALRSVPRDLFLPSDMRYAAWEDSPQPIGCGQTISQPFVVALMTEMLRLRPEDSVLEIGTGSGYQTAVLARLARVVYSAEIVPELARSVAERLETLGIDNVVLGVGDGLRIFREDAPFDAIIAAAAPPAVPQELIDQLADGGRCVIPVGGLDFQYLYLIERQGDRILTRECDPVRFVPLLSGASGQRG